MKLTVEEFEMAESGLTLLGLFSTVSTCLCCSLFYKNLPMLFYAYMYYVYLLCLYIYFFLSLYLLFYLSCFPLLLLLYPAHFQQDGSPL